MKKAVLRVGLLGLGGDAHFWIEAYLGAKGAELVGAADPDEAARAVFAGGDVPIFSSLSDLLKLNLDVLEINLPPAAQFDAVMMALEANLHLGLRFPLAPSATKLEKLGGVMRGKAVRCGPPHMYYAPVRHALKFMEEDRIGDIQTIRIKALTSDLGGWHERKPTVPLPHDLESYGRQWQALPLLMILGKVERVHVFGRPENAMVTVRYEGHDRLGVYEAVYAPQTKIRAEGTPAAETMEIAGIDGYINVRRLSGQVREEPALSTVIHDTMAAYAGDLPITWQSAFDAAANNLLNAVWDKDRVWFDLPAAVRAQQLLAAIENSFREGREVLVKY